MVISRGKDTQYGNLLRNETLISDDAGAADTSISHETSDFKQIERQYGSDAESGLGGVSTGAQIPQDMTVKLVRAEAANWETFLSVLYSITLTFFGLFLGAWVTSSSAGKNWTSLEVVATVAFGLISSGLVITWVVIKIRQQRHGAVLPYDVLNKYQKTEQEAAPDATRQ